MAEPDEPEPAESVLVLSDDELARISDVAPWFNDLDRSCDSYQYTSYVDYILRTGGSCFPRDMRNTNRDWDGTGTSKTDPDNRTL